MATPSSSSPTMGPGSRRRRARPSSIASFAAPATAAKPEGDVRFDVLYVDDEVVGDCLRSLHAGLAGVKFLGSYPAAGEHGAERRRQAGEADRAADEWLRALRRGIE